MYLLFNQSALLYCISVFQHVNITACSASPDNNTLLQRVAHCHSMSQLKLTGWLSKGQDKAMCLLFNQTALQDCTVVWLHCSIAVLPDYNALQQRVAQYAQHIATLYNQLLRCATCLCTQAHFCVSQVGMSSLLSVHPSC